jgi:serine/threonine protein kinase
VLTCLRISLLCIEGSDGPARQAERKFYEGWLESKRDKHQAELDQVRGKLDYAPFTKEEWEIKGYEVPKKDPAKRMARLGQGGFMTTYRMKSATGEWFAVKMVKTEDMIFQGITRKDVEREARTLERMKHKHVIQYHRLYEDDEEEVVGIVMEWAKGGSLADLIKARAERSQNVGMPELLEINIQMAKALDYIHGEGILHRDVKADNVLLANADGEKVCIKLADFGVAAVLTHTARTKSHTSGRGTEKYYSPEKARSKAYGTKADMWAVGCIIIELACCDLLTGALWSVDDLEVQDRRNKNFTQVRERCAGLANIVHNLLHSDASSRRSASELRRSLEKLKNCLEQEKLKNGIEQDKQAGDVAVDSGSGAACSEGVKNQNTKKEQGQAVIDRIDLTQESQESESNVQSIKPQEEEASNGGGKKVADDESDEEQGQAATHPNKKQKVGSDTD